MHETLPPNRFSIFHRGLAKGQAYEAWREGICRGFCRLDVGPAEADYIVEVLRRWLQESTAG